MEQLINSRRLASSDDNLGSHSLVFKIQNIIKIAILLVATFVVSFSFAQDKPMKDQGDIAYRLRKDYKRNTVNEVDKIPVATRDQFDEDFSNVEDVSWKVGQGYNEVDFIMNNKLMMAFYNYDDELIGRGHYVDYMDLPLKGRQRIEKDYGDYIPEQAMYFHDDEGDDDFLNLLGNFLPEEAYFVLLKNENKDEEIVVQVDEDGGIAYFSNVRKK